MASTVDHRTAHIEAGQTKSFILIHLLTPNEKEISHGRVSWQTH